MRIKEMLQDDDAVSPVIGVILMVAITVILAAVIASFVLGLGPGEATPTASFDIEVNDDNDIEVAHSTGSTIDPANLEVQAGGNTYGFDNTSEDDHTLANVGSEVSSGSSVTIDGGLYGGTVEVSVVWTGDGQSAEIDSGEVSL